MSEGTGQSNAHAVDMDLRVDALLAAARLEDPRSLGPLSQLAQHREKQIRIGALYGLLRLASKPDKSGAGKNSAALQAVFEQASGDPRSTVKALGFLGLGTLAGGSGRGLSPRQRT